jgi:hypothetical protein
MKKQVITFFSCMLLLYGCGGLDRKIAADKSASPLIIDDPSLVSRLVASLQQTNQNIRSYKGVGRVQFSRASTLQSARIVFAGDDTRKLRFEILGISGQPLTSIAYDGTWLYVAQHSENLYYQKRSATGDLSQMITLPVRLEELNALLSGRVPLLEYGSVQLQKDPDQEGYLLILKTGWPQQRKEHIYLHSDMKTVWKYQLFKGTNALIYEAAINYFKTDEGYIIPQHIEFKDKNTNFLRLEIDRYWPNAEIDSAVFVLTKPG